MLGKSQHHPLAILEINRIEDDSPWYIDLGNDENELVPKNPQPSIFPAYPDLQFKFLVVFSDRTDPKGVKRKKWWVKFLDNYLNELEIVELLGCFKRSLDLNNSPSLQYFVGMYFKLIGYLVLLSAN